MKALKEFDYNLWTTEENGVKKYFVGVKATGEVTEVDAEVMKVLRNEEKKMRRHIEEEGELGAPLSLDSAVGDENNSTWMTDTYNLAEDVQTEIMEVNFIRSLSPLQKAVYRYCVKGDGSPSDFAAKQGISKQAVSNTLRKIREKAKIFFGCKGTMIREMINELCSAGVTICSDRNGYYIAKSREELDRTIVQLKSRVKKIQSAIDGLEAVRM